MLYFHYLCCHLFGSRMFGNEIDANARLVQGRAARPMIKIWRGAARQKPRRSGAGRGGQWRIGGRTTQGVVGAVICVVVGPARRCRRAFVVVCGLPVQHGWRERRLTRPYRKRQRNVVVIIVVVFDVNVVGVFTVVAVELAAAIVGGRVKVVSEINVKLYSIFIAKNGLIQQKTTSKKKLIVNE